jgi:hypothetical protein
VADWRGYGYLEFDGQVLGPKSEEFRRFMSLPGRSACEFEIALRIAPDDPDLVLLRQNGWNIVDPARVADPSRYRTYVTASSGEFSCAKGGYVGTRSGWFSDRSACYMAAGRPVILQSTGFEERLPTGRGLFAVRTVEEAVDAAARVSSDYAWHSAGAREIAREFFDSHKIMQTMLQAAGL